MSKKDKDDILLSRKCWYEKDEKDWTELDRLEEYVDSKEWDELPQWKKDIFKLQTKPKRFNKKK